MYPENDGVRYRRGLKRDRQWSDESTTNDTLQLSMHNPRRNSNLFEPLRQSPTRRHHDRYGTAYGSPPRRSRGSREGKARREAKRRQRKYPRLEDFGLANLTTVQSPAAGQPMQPAIRYNALAEIVRYRSELDDTEVPHANTLTGLANTSSIVDPSDNAHPLACRCIRCNDLLEIVRANTDEEEWMDFLALTRPCSPSEAEWGVIAREEADSEWEDFLDVIEC